MESSEEQLLGSSREQNHRNYTYTPVPIPKTYSMETRQNGEKSSSEESKGRLTVSENTTVTNKRGAPSIVHLHLEPLEYSRDLIR